MKECKIGRLVLGMISTNCYLIRKETSDQVVVVDPADAPTRILEAVDSMEGRLAAILLTHGHFDHIGAVEALQKETHAQVYAMRQEEALLGDPQANLSAGYGRPITVAADHWLEDGEVFSIGEMAFTALYTPGHTHGGGCFYLPSEAVLFSGDTLFEGSVGRTDFPTGSMSVLVRSIREKLLCLPDETLVLPGHGDATTIGSEKHYNPYLQ